MTQGRRQKFSRGSDLPTIIVLTFDDQAEKGWTSDVTQSRFAKALTAKIRNFPGKTGKGYIPSLSDAAYTSWMRR